MPPSINPSVPSARRQSNVTRCASCRGRIRPYLEFHRGGKATGHPRNSSAAILLGAVSISSLINRAAAVREAR